MKIIRLANFELFYLTIFIILLSIYWLCGALNYICCVGNSSSNKCTYPLELTQQYWRSKCRCFRNITTYSDVIFPCMKINIVMLARKRSLRCMHLQSPHYVWETVIGLLTYTLLVSRKWSAKSVRETVYNVRNLTLLLLFSHNYFVLHLLFPFWVFLSIKK